MRDYSKLNFACEQKEYIGCITLNDIRLCFSIQVVWEPSLLYLEEDIFQVEVLHSK